MRLSPIAAKKFFDERYLGSVAKPVITGLAFMFGLTDGGCTKRVNTL